MERIVITFADPKRSAIRVDDVETRWDGTAGRQRHALAPVQATRVVGAWMQAQPGRAIRYAAWRVNAWTWVLADERGEEREWRPVEDPTGAALPLWFVHTFPWPVRTRKPISESVALSTIQAFVNRPGGVNGGDLVDVVCEVLEQAGMPVTD